MKNERWWIVAASAVALVASPAPIIIGAGIFMKPISDELGFGRGNIATAIGITSLTTAIASPIFGRLIDRFGVRTPLAVSIVLYALTTALLSCLPGSIIGLYSLFALTGLFAAGPGPGSYSKVVTAWFDRQRGLALGIVLAGVGAGTAVVPVLCNYLIGTFGWRGGYLGLAAFIILLALVPVLAFVREPGEDRSLGVASGTTQRQPTLPGVTVGEAVRDRRFWFLLVSFFFAVVATNGTLIHVVPMLTDRGVPLPQAIQIISVSGLALIAGRLLAGWITDKVFAPYVAMFFLASPAIGLLILGTQPEGIPPFVGVLLVGLGIGGETDLLSYMVSRYFGLLNFGTIYGWMFMAALLGNFVGSSIMGWTFQIAHSYSIALIGYSGLLVIACILTLRVGPYRYPPRASHETTAEPKLEAVA